MDFFSFENVSNVSDRAFGPYVLHDNQLLCLGIETYMQAIRFRSPYFAAIRP